MEGSNDVLLPRLPKTSERVTTFSVKSGRDHNLRCSIEYKDHESCDIAVLCHGLFSSRNHRLIRHLSKQIPINTVTFDFHGNGESDGVDDWSFGGYWAEVEDLRDVLSFLRKNQFRVVAIIGHSRGANDVLLYAARYDDVPVILSVAGRFDMSRGITKHFTPDQLAALEAHKPFTMISCDGKQRVITHQGIDDRKAIDMLSYLAQVKKSKLVMLHGTADETIPHQDSQQLKKCVDESSAEVVLIEGASHFFGPQQHINELTRHVVNFVKWSCGTTTSGTPPCLSADEEKGVRGGVLLLTP